MKLSEQAMVTMVMLFQRSLLAAARGEEENFLDRAAVLEFELGDDEKMYCLNPPGVDAVNVDEFVDDEGFLGLEEE
jgi:hypothetical protein